jgi:hypothetical protein
LIHHKGTKDTKEEIQRQGAKDAKAGFARIKAFEGWRCLSALRAFFAS